MNSAKQLESLKVLASSLLAKVNEIELVHREEKPIFKKNKHLFYPSDIVILVNDKFGVDVKSKSQKRDVSDARAAACFLLKRYSDLTLKDIAMQVSRTDHTTAINAISTCINIMDTEPAYKDTVDAIIKDIELLISR